MLAAWLNHFDAREQNTLSVWIDHGDDAGHEVDVRDLGDGVDDLHHPGDE